MTRCYESYCYFKGNPHPCKGDRTIERIKDYIEFMESKGVHFDRSVGDKGLFSRLKNKYGSEFAVTQPSVLTEPETEQNTSFGERSSAEDSLGEQNSKSCPDNSCEAATVLKDTEVIVECPICNSKCLLIHADPSGSHQIREVIE